MVGWSLGHGEAGHRADVLGAGLLVARLVGDPLHPLEGAGPGLGGPADVDVLGPLPELREDVHLFGEHFAEAPEAGEVPPLSVLAIAQAPHSPLAHEGGTPHPPPPLAL